MTPFKVTMTLFNEVIMPHPLTLDALLAALISRETGLRDEDLIPLIPLKQTEGVFHGSVIMTMNKRQPVEHLERVFVMALRGVNDKSVHAFQPNGGTKNNRRYTWIDPARLAYKNNMSAYQAKRCQSVMFYGCGDIERVTHLFTHFFMGLGKRATRGQGQVEHVTVTPVQEDFSLVLPDQQPARPIPVEAWQALRSLVGGTENPMVAMAGHQVPYHNTSNQTLCAVPPALF